MASTYSVFKYSMISLRSFIAEQAADDARSCGHADSRPPVASSEWPRLLLPWSGFPSAPVTANRVSPVLAIRRFIGLDVETDLLRIEIAKTHAELFRALCCGHQHPPQRWHRTIVKVGRGRPDAVQWAGAIVQIRASGLGQFLSRAPKAPSDPRPKRDCHSSIFC